MGQHDQLPTTDRERTIADTQRTEFIKQSYEKEAESLGITDAKDTGLTAYQISLLDKIRDLNKFPPATTAPGTKRSDAQVAASVEIHKRVNPGYVEMPYCAGSQVDFAYRPPPDFTKAFLKKDSDCAFQKYAAEAILKHVDLKKTSH